jgi:hypothetical protein
MHSPLEVHELVTESVIARGLRSRAYDVRPIKTHLDNTVHVARVANVLYLADLGLQVIDGRWVPDEGIVNPWNLEQLQRALSRKAQADPAPPPYASAFGVTRVREDVCILSNMFSTNFCHFAEELLKVVLLERSGFRPRYVYTTLPPFAFDFWDALGLDRGRLLQIPCEPVVFRSAYYTTRMDFGDLGPCPDVFFELRDRLSSAASAITSRYGPRLWLDRGIHVSDPTRGLVNAHEIDDVLDEYGFTRLDIASLPLLEQVAAACRAEVMAGAHGAAFIHSMFMPPRSTVIEVFSPQYLNHCWGAICRVLKHRYAMLADYNAPHCPYQFGKQVNVPCAQLRITFDSLLCE